MFAWILGIQWVASIFLAWFLTPFTWEGEVRSFHPNLLVAIFGGGFISLVPLYHCLKNSKAWRTRLMVAVAMPLMSILLIHLSGGRIEAHFHVFVSLAVLAFYRERKVLVISGIVVVLDHLIRGYYWPQSVFGSEVAHPIWRALEHGAWVMLEVVFLAVAISRSNRELRQTIGQQLEMERLLKENEEKAVAFKELSDTLEESNRGQAYRERLFMSLIENLPSGGALLIRQDGQVLIAGGKDLPCKDLPKMDEEGFSLEEVFGKRAAEIRAKLTECHDGFESRFDFETEEEVYRCALTYLPHPKMHRSRWLMVFQNVTMDLRNQAQAERLQRLDSVGHLAGGIAHDFNNYLSSILGNIAIARESPELASEALHDAETACVASRQLTRQLLTFSKGGAPVKSKGDLKRVVRDAAKFSLSGSEIVWEIEAPVDLWSIEFDEGQVGQIVSNLCVNAHQAMDGRGKIQIELTNISPEACPEALGRGEFIRVSVKDDGPGISSEVLSQIWNPYFTTKKMGSGLGLATCHSIAEGHGGMMTVESKLGEGSTFTLWIPAQGSALSDTVVELPPDTDLPKCRILLMDDQAPIRMVAKRIFEKLGQQMTVVEDGVQALGVYRDAEERNEPFDLVILDMTIPGGMGGLETVSRLRENHNNVYAIVCSGYTDENNLGYYHEVGFDAMLSKPFTPQEVRKALADYAKSKRGLAA